MSTLAQEVEKLDELKMSAYAGTVWGPFWDQAAPAEVAMRRDVARRLMYVGALVEAPDYMARVRAVEAGQ